MSNGSRSRSFRRWMLGIAALVGAYWLYAHITGPVIVTAALSDGRVRAQVISSSSDGSKATITLTRAAGSSGDITIAIPAGTVIRGDNLDTQRLVTAVALTIHLSDAVPTVTQVVETFCIDEFAAIPTAQSVLSFQGASESSTTEETEPLHKLVDCAADLPDTVRPHFDKQLAVWLVAGGLLHKTPAEALESVTNGLEKRIAAEKRAKLDGEGRALLHRNHPSLSDAEIDRLIDAEYQREAVRIHDIAVTAAKDHMADFRQYGRDVLEMCGYKRDDMLVFS